MASTPATALITGGTSGIGKAVAKKLAQLGVHVFVVGRNAECGAKTVDEIRAAGGKVDFISSDLRDASSARSVATGYWARMRRRAQRARLSTMNFLPSSSSTELPA